LPHHDDIPGLVAQGRTIAETLEIARDIAKKLLEDRQEWQTPIHLNEIEGESSCNYGITRV
jgi:predicted RNase H-like HicB family nuclease